MTDTERYINYLGRMQRNEKKSLYELHQSQISRSVARQYGLSNEEIEELDATFSQRKGAVV